MSKQDWRLLLKYKALGRPEELARVVHGRWKDARKGLSSCKCTVCGAVYETETPYCPSCGAKMEKE